MLNIWYANDLPYGPRPIWARAHMGPGPLGPGPFLVGQTPHQKTHPGKKSPNCVFCVFFGNKKDARRPYDHFGGGIAPRSLLCVRKRRFPFLKPRCFCAAKMLFWGNRLPEPGEPAAHYGGTEAIPNLSVQVETYNRGLPNYATGLAVNSVSDLLRALRPADPTMPPRLLQQIGEYPCLNYASVIPALARNSDNSTATSATTAERPPRITDAAIRLQTPCDCQS